MTGEQMTGLEVRVRGQVQGVGFRPFVWLLARDMGLTGEVLNDAQGVLVRIYGETDGFEARLKAELPPLARIDSVESHPISGLAEDFRIVASEGGEARTRVTPDAATCAHCVEEIHDAEARRHGYAFTNCTHCGPRFTIVEGLPYDRPKTTMAPYEMCPACRAEYENPEDRRFHAQPIACPDCGPRIWVEPESEGDPIEVVAKRLLAGEIVAIKGLGGFHLACDATNQDAVQTLRDRKRRPAKPFALMGSLPMIRDWCAVTEDEQALLEYPAAPIVLLEANKFPEGIAPGQSTLGWMLPYTPLHHLLIDTVGRPLVMTSGNLSGEPQVIDNQEARDKLSGFVDAYLMHDRKIARRLDDSVERITPQGPMVLRRARGRVPGTLPLPKGFENAPQIVAYGGQMKGAICLIKDGQALLGHHLGELDEALTYEAFLKADADYAELFDHRPEIAACDLHPEFRATIHAYETGLPVEEVQHHHAHLAACLGENGWPLDGGKVAGIVLDGLGLGTDGTVWGGEILLGDYREFERTAWLKPAPLIGGDMAAKEPWRNLLARMDQAGCGDAVEDLLPDDAPVSVLRRAVERGVNAPMSSSAGRLFDAFAALLGFHQAQSFEGQAAMWLEARALKEIASDGFDALEALGLSFSNGEIDPTVLFMAVIDPDGAGVGDWTRTPAALFHASLAQAFADEARGLVVSGKAQAVALTGGVFQNALLLDLTLCALGDVPVLIHTKTPANDGGLALGQALVAAARRL
ncbi:carbamoyltransferase HypF [Celeribacter litoreus]|uniref:carbamoyltransferase HypF n=1 Tax=Celeribacter litoreus TaxID=2876714 RepID=UPI001CCD94CF|nr:carbamoyltransferase HypF [Celeribacter litoreus]MCA0043208.1 carbamoyltransferase HypF [Celeribacter litoreus]